MSSLKTTATIPVDNEKVDKLRALARKNSIKVNKENIIDMALSISISVYENADDETFYHLTNLKQ